MIKVIATQCGIATSREYLKDTSAHSQDRDIKSSATKIVDSVNTWSFSQHVAELDSDSERVSCAKLIQVW